MGQLVGNGVEGVAREALPARDGLFATPLARGLHEMRLGHLDVPAEDTRVSELEARDARRFTQPRLQLDDVALAAAHQIARVVELPVEAVANDATLAGAKRRIVGHRAREQTEDVVALVQPRLAVSQAQRLARRRGGGAG